MPEENKEELIHERNYVGKVTRHSKKAGVTLRARVTSPSGNVTVYKDFKCMVKAMGLTDEQAVIIDLNYVSNLLAANGVTGIKNNLTSYMPVSGPNETKIKYEVSGGDIERYFNSDGVVITRPAFGEAAKVGTMTVTVTRNLAEAKKHISISVDPYSIEEVQESIAGSITWTTIKGKNWEESETEATNGPSNVIYPLELPTQIKSDLMPTATPIPVEWSIESDALADIMSGNQRINLVTGEIYRPSHAAAYEASESNSAYKTFISPCSSRIDGNQPRVFMRLGGLVLKASFKISDLAEGAEVENSVKFNLKTLSMPVTNTEVSNYLKSKISEFKIRDLTYSQVFNSETQNDGEPMSRTVYIGIGDSSSKASKLRLFNEKDIVAITSLNNNFTGESDGIKISRLNWNIIDPKTMGAEGTEVALDGSGVGVYSTRGLTLDTNTGEITLTLDLEKGAKFPEEEPRIVLRASMSVAQYSDTVSPFTIFYWFKCLDATEPDPVIPDDSESGGSGGETGGTGQEVGGDTPVDNPDETSGS